MPDEKPEVEVVDDSEKDVEDTVSEVVVDLEKEKVESEPLKPKQEASKTPNEDYSKLKNRQLWLERQQEKMLREYQKLAEAYQVSRQESTVQRDKQNVDEIDEIAQKDWKLGVKKVVEKDIEAKVQEILEKRDEALKAVQRQAALESELEKSKQQVLSKYPQLETDDSEEASLYRNVINEDSTLLSNIHGPEIAMYRMEERMRQMGKTPPTIKPIVDREVNRLVRAGASSVVGRQASPNGKITLTREQKEFCDHYKIPYEQYAKNLKAQETTGGIEA